MEKWIKDVEYIIMPAKSPQRGLEEKYDATYNCWRSAWEKFRLEIGVKEKLFSDGFVGTDEVGAIFYQGKCVALSCFTYGSLAQGSPTKDLSWFKGWTDLARMKLGEISHNAVISSQFSVSPEFTGKGHFVRWKEILFLYIFMRFEHSISDVMAGHLNLSRKVDDACGEACGATVLNPNHPFNYYGVELPAQLVAYQKQNIALMKERRSIQQLCDDLWSRMTCVSNYPIIDTSYDLKKVA